MRNIFSNFGEFLKEDNGNQSSMRLVFLVWGLGTFFVWLILSFIDGELKAIPESVVTASAIFLVGKVSQKFGEQKG